MGTISFECECCTAACLDYYVYARKACDEGETAFPFGPGTQADYDALIAFIALNPTTAFSYGGFTWLVTGTASFPCGDTSVGTVTSTWPATFVAYDPDTCCCEGVGDGTSEIPCCVEVTGLAWAECDCEINAGQPDWDGILRAMGDGTSYTDEGNYYDPPTGGYKYLPGLDCFPMLITLSYDNASGQWFLIIMFGFDPTWAGTGPTDPCDPRGVYTYTQTSWPPGSPNGMPAEPACSGPATLTVGDCA